MSDPTTNDRTLDAFRLLVRNEDPVRTYQGLHEYAVQRADASTFDGAPTDPDYSPALPTQVPYRPALAGSSCVPTVGTLAYVMFANSNPSKPVLVAFGPTLPTSATVDATGIVEIGPTAEAVHLAGGNVTLTDGTGRVVRYGDPIVFGPPGAGFVEPGIVLNHFSKVTG
jgi:hypothetical protein